MADELTLAGSLKFSSGKKTFERILSGLKISLTTKKYVHVIHSIGTTEEAVDLGEVTGALGFAIFLNFDTTNFYEVRASTGGTKIIKVPPATADSPGFAGPFWFGTGVTAPYVIADTAAVEAEYIIFMI